MNDRPRGSGRPEEGTPEYDWLYGPGRGAAPDDQATQRVPTSPRGAPPPDATRKMPTLPREGAGRPGGQPVNQGPYQTPPPPPRQPGRPGQPPTAGRPRRRRRPPVLRVLLLLLALWLVYLVAVPFWAWNKVSSVDAFPAAADRPAEQGGTTYLLVGSDSRAGLTRAQRRAYGTGSNEGQRTDTIMLLHVGAGPDLLMSIPRDSLVDIPGRGTSKINAAYAVGGPKLLTETIEQSTGIRIDHYVEIGFGGFVKMIDAVDGVRICPEKAYVDEDAHLDVKAGCQTADGATALAYSRSRHAQRLGDIDRAKHQREVVGALAGEVASPRSVLDPVRYWKLNTAAASVVTVSDGTGAVAMARFAWAMTRIGNGGLTCGVPIANLAVNWDPRRSTQMFRAIINDDTESIPAGLCTPSGLPKSVVGNE